jgi:hypothetical protein
MTLETLKAREEKVRRQYPFYCALLAYLDDVLGPKIEQIMNDIML